MAFSWNTIGGVESPVVRGRPEQFKEVSATFETIAERSGPLIDDLWELRRGRSEGFAGETAESVGMRIGEFIGRLSYVPEVSATIGSTFERHGCRLEELEVKASEALARARTRWNRKQSAESEIQNHKSSISWLNRQISQLHCYCAGPCACNVEARRSNLESQRRNAEYDLGCASSELSTAEGLLDDSRNDHRAIRQEEDDLNESTAHRLKVMPLWSLRDTGNVLSEAVENVNAWISEAWDFFVDELLQVLHDALTTLLDWLDAAGLILEWIPVVNVAFKAVELFFTVVKAGVGLGLVLSGQMSLSEFIIDTAIDAAGVALPGGRLIGKGIKKVFKSGCLDRAMKFVTKNVDEVEGYAKRQTAGIAKATYRVPVIKQLNDFVYGRSRVLLFKGARGYTPRRDRFFPDLDRQSWITRTARDNGFVHTKLLNPFGKSPERFATDRIFQVGVNEIEARTEWLMDRNNRFTPYSVLVPCTLQKPIRLITGFTGQ